MGVKYLRYQEELEEAKMEARESGYAEGREAGYAESQAANIRLFVEFLKEADFDKARIVAGLMDKFSLDKEAAEKAVE